MGALSTYSKFYYGIRTTLDEYILNFKEGAGPELTIAIPINAYSLEELRTQLQLGFNNAGALTYSVSLNRTTRAYTISASGTFSLLGATGTGVGSGAWAVIGFPNTDQLNITSATGTAVGFVYSPQFIIQDYLPKENGARALTATVNKSASGRKVSVQSFGEERFIKGNIKFITDRYQPPNQRIRNNPNAVSEVRAFLDDIILKGPFEFMPDESRVDVYTKVLLESTRDSKDGVGYELTEYVDRFLPDVFETGLLVFRVLD